MAHATRPLHGQTDVPCSALVDRVLAQIDGALGASVLVGLDSLVVCRCDGPGGVARVPRPPFRLDELESAGIVHYGSLPVLVLIVNGRPDPLPVLILERHQIGAALDEIVVLRRLIASARGGAAPRESSSYTLPTELLPLRIAR